MRIYNDYKPFGSFYMNHIHRICFVNFTFTSGTLKIAQQWCKLVGSGEAAIVKVCAKQYLVENGFAESLLQLIVGGNFSSTFALFIHNSPPVSSHRGK